MDARKPRKQVVTFTKRELVESIFAVIRVSWHKNGKECDVQEIQLESDLEEKEYVLHHIVKSALTAGADVTVVSPFCIDEMGIDK